MMLLFKRKQYGHPGDSRASDRQERRDAQMTWLETEVARRANELRIARIEGATHLITARLRLDG